MATSILTPELPTGQIPAVFTPKEGKDLPESLAAHFAAQTNGKQTDGVKSSTGEQWAQHQVSFRNEYALNPRKLRVITIGAGFSGLLIAHKFQHRFPELQEFVEHTIFEGRKDLGGTWLVNTYPGVQCDVPSHIYVSKYQICEYLQIADFSGFPLRPQS